MNFVIFGHYYQFNTSKKATTVVEQASLVAAVSQQPIPPVRSAAPPIANRRPVALPNMSTPVVTVSTKPAVREVPVKPQSGRSLGKPTVPLQNAYEDVQIFVSNTSCGVLWLIYNIFCFVSVCIPLTKQLRIIVM